MKIRTGFVSNSSSSSFVCEFCGREESGWDMTTSEAGMCECENGHLFCQSHVISEVLEVDGDNVIEKLGGSGEDTEDPNFDYIPAEHCPLCQFKRVSDSDLINYLLAKVESTRDEVADELRTNFNNYDEFIDYVKGKKNG